MVEQSQRNVETATENTGSDHEKHRKKERKKIATTSRRKNHPPASPLVVESKSRDVDSPIPHKLKEDSTSPSSEVERPGKLTRLQVDAIQRAYKRGMTREQIRDLMGYGLSTVYKHTQNVEVDNASLSETSNGDDSESQPQPTQAHVDAMQKLARGGLEAETIAKATGWSVDTVSSHIRDIVPDRADSVDQTFVFPAVPKLPSEVTGPRPRIEEMSNGHGEEQQRPVVLVENNGESYAPVRVIVDPNSPYLQELLIELLHLAAARDVPFKRYLEGGLALQDLRNANFAATLVPGESSEEFRRNLLSIAKKANLHDRYRTDAGLEATGVHS